MKNKLRVIGKCILGVFAVAGAIQGVSAAEPSTSSPPAHAAEAPVAAFDFDKGNALTDVVLQSVGQVFLGPVGVGVGDATLILRVGVLLTNACFDAIAPYHPTAVGVYSRLGRRPASEGATNRNKNVAMLFASYQVLNSMYPAYVTTWREMLSSVGLDPDAQTDTASASGIGNAAGKGVVAAREHDGMNQLGDENGRQYNGQPYADYIGYVPTNTPYKLTDPSHWQPNVVTKGNGLFQTQQFVTPQMRVTRPYSYANPNQFHAPAPTDSNYRNKKAYKQQADEVLAISAGLTDQQKMTAEFFNNKLMSIGQVGSFVEQSKKLTLDQFIQYDFLVNLTAFDGAIAAWNEKYRYNAVRPFSAIHYLYGNRRVAAWGGPGKGTVKDIRGSEWRSYLNTPDHPEYPSGSACFCAAHSEASRRYLGSDDLGWSIPFEKGSSDIEPGITPAAKMVLTFNTWTEFEEQCGMSRVLGGVHFKPAIKAGHDLCKPIGDTAYMFVKKHIDGSVNPL